MQEYPQVESAVNPNLVANQFSRTRTTRTRTKKCSPPRPIAIGYWLLAIGYWLCAPLSCSIVQTYGAIHVRVPLRGIEKKLDAAAGLLPLIADHGFHYVALRLFVPG